MKGRAFNQQFSFLTEALCSIPVGPRCFAPLCHFVASILRRTRYHVATKADLSRKAVHALDSCKEVRNVFRGINQVFNRV